LSVEISPDILSEPDWYFFFNYTVSQKTSPTFLAITRESIDGFFYNIWQKCYWESKQSYVAIFFHSPN